MIRDNSERILRKPKKGLRVTHEVKLRTPTDSKRCVLASLGRLCQLSGSTPGLKSRHWLVFAGEASLTSPVLYILQRQVSRITQRADPTNVVLLLGEAWLERSPFPGFERLIE
jgi:hypothetical protein